jgi:trk system potassium uptake protein TrkA
VLICTVERDDEAYIPNGNFVFKGKDVISIIGSQKDASDFFKKIGYSTDSAKDAIILGGGDITHYLASMLSHSIDLKVVDKDRELCEVLAKEFKEVTVINGDEKDQELLVEEGVATADAFLSLTEHDEENILLSLFARKTGAGKVITKINRADYDDIFKHLDLDTAIYPKSITSDMILRYVRALQNTFGSNVETMYNVIKGKVEASEFKVTEGSPISAAPLMQLHFKKDVLVAAILRGGSVIIPRGNDTILPGDSVIIVTKQLGLMDISDILAD